LVVEHGMTGIRSYLAGTGASGSLLAAMLVAFVAVTAFVAFDGVPIGSDGDDAGTISLEGPSAAAAAAAAGVGAPATVAAAPAGPGAGGPGAPGIAGAGGPGAGAGGGAAGAPAPGTPGGGTPIGGPGTQAPVTPPAGGGAPTNPVDNAVAGVDTSVQNATGVNPNLGGATKPITSAVDQALQDATGNDLGGHLGNVGQKP
jgi:hypothetical protein